MRSMVSVSFNRETSFSDITLWAGIVCQVVEESRLQDNSEFIKVESCQEFMG